MGDGVMVIEENNIAEKKEGYVLRISGYSGQALPVPVLTGIGPVVVLFIKTSTFIHLLTK